MYKDINRQGQRWDPRQWTGMMTRPSHYIRLLMIIYSLTMNGKQRHVNMAMATGAWDPMRLKPWYVFSLFSYKLRTVVTNWRHVNRATRTRQQALETHCYLGGKFSLIFFKQLLMINQTTDDRVQRWHINNMVTTTVNDTSTEIRDTLLLELYISLLSFFKLLLMISIQINCDRAT